MRLTIRTKLLIILTLVAVVSAGVSAYMGYSSAGGALEEQTFAQLTVVREMKAIQVEEYFGQIVDQTITFSNDRMIVDAAIEFGAAFASISREVAPDSEQSSEIDLRLREHYQREFLPRLVANLGHEEPLSQFIPPDAETKVLQDVYIATNPFDTGTKKDFDGPLDDTNYSRVHRLYHPIIRDFLERFGYYDIFIVDADTGHIVYSVFKEVDFGSSLLDGPYRETNLARAFHAARQSHAPDFVKLVDFSPYAPSYDAFASFIASPIFDGETKVGVLVFQMPVDRINGIMTNDGRWSEIGLGRSGESYIVGEDLTLRSESRFLLEDRETYLATIRDNPQARSAVDGITRLNSAIGLQRVETDGVMAAFAGKTGSRLHSDYRGTPVLASYRPLILPDVEWVIMSEIDEAEAFDPVRTLRNRVLTFMSVLVITIACVAWVFSRSLTRPLKDLTHHAAGLAKGSLGISIDTSGHDEIADLSRSLDVMRQSLEKLIDRQERAIDALSVPMIPLRDDVVAMPLVGELDSRRLARVRNELVEGLSRTGARVALLDMTGVPSLDKDGATGIESAVKAARLVGAQVIVTGIRPEIARDMADLELHFDGISIERSIQNGIAVAMGMITGDTDARDSNAGEENEA